MLTSEKYLQQEYKLTQSTNQIGLTYQLLSFSDILPTWKSKLWIGRSNYSQTSSMLIGGKTGDNNRFTPTFFGFVNDHGDVVAVNSGHKCVDSSYRSRGLWVEPMYRGHGIGELLLIKSKMQSIIERTYCVWSLPRQTSWSTYSRAGFVLAGMWFSTDTSPANSYCISSNFNSESPTIHLLDQDPKYGDHCARMRAVLADLTTAAVNFIPMPTSGTDTFLIQVIENLRKVVKPTDIVLAPWVIAASDEVDQSFIKLQEKCYVVVAAGNQGISVSNYSPARAVGLTTIGALNKSLTPAKFSNTETDVKKLTWVPGTNYSHSTFVDGGTSVASAVYAALLSNSLGDGVSLDQLLSEYRLKVSSELNS